MEFAIRRLKDSQAAKVLPAMAELYGQLVATNALPVTEETLGALLRSETAVAIGAFDGSRLVGVMTMNIVPLPNRLVCYMDDLVVHKDYRGGKLGVLLMETGIALARRQGAYSCHGTSHPRRESANRTFREVGFVVRETNAIECRL